MDMLSRRTDASLWQIRTMSLPFTTVFTHRILCNPHRRSTQLSTFQLLLFPRRFVHAPDPPLPRTRRPLKRR
eukprot:5908787-Pleurochrysis_carterae.AAC.1